VVDIYSEVDAKWILGLVFLEDAFRRVLQGITLIHALSICWALEREKSKGGFFPFQSRPNIHFAECLFV
jgi:hypothetical protein